MKIGILGGTFDPIHEGHMHIARAALRNGVDKVIFMPAGRPPHKETPGATKQDRLQMVRLAASENPAFEVSDYEIQKDEPSYSVETLRHFHEVYPEDEFYFLLGDDAYYLVEYWYEAEEVKRLTQFMVFTREGVEIAPPAIGVEIPICPVSSTEIRKDCAEGRSITGKVPKSVEAYIKDKHLYKEMGE